MNSCAFLGLYTLDLAGKTQHAPRQMEVLSGYFTRGAIPQRKCLSPLDWAFKSCRERKNMLIQNRHSENRPGKPNKETC